MPRIPGVNHRRAVRAFEKVGFVVQRETGHIVMARGQTRLIIPRHNPIDAFTMGSIVTRAGLTVEEFRNLL